MDKLKIRIDFQVLNDNGKRILVFDVASRPIGLVVDVDGKYWWRKGDSLVIMPSNILQKILFESGHDFSGDICPGATINDLDKKAIEAFRAKWVEKSGNKRLKTLSVKQLLTDCEAIIDNGITYAALILFGTRAALGKYLSQSEVVFEYRSNNASGVAQQREEFRIGFFCFYDKIWELVNLRNDKQHYQDGLFIFDVPTFNERIVREALLNAVSHRNYQLSGSVFIRQYPDKLVIDSPGGFPKGITLDNIINKQFPRNRRIAEIFALCGLVERSGQGMNMMYELSIKEAKSLPDFTGTDDYSVCLTLNGIILDKRMLLFLKNIGEERLISLSTEDFLVINSLFYQKKLSAELKEYAERLIDTGIVERIGRNKFVLARGLYDVTGKSGIHTRIVGLDRETNKELILKHIKKCGKKGAPLKEIQQVLPSHSRGQLQDLLRELRDEKKIASEGKTKGAIWFPL